MLSLIGMKPVQHTSWRADRACGVSTLSTNVRLPLNSASDEALALTSAFLCLAFFFFLQIFHLNAKVEASKNVRNKLVLVCDNKPRPRCPFTREIPEWSDLFMGRMISLQACRRDLGWLLSQVVLNLQKKSGRVNAAEGRWCRREDTGQVNT